MEMGLIVIIHFQANLEREGGQQVCQGDVALVKSRPDHW